jgi:formylglycine-generating enzyme required for sulfatase activity
LPDAGVDAGLDAAIDASLPGLTGCPDLDGGGENCCTSNEVPGGTFYVSYDGISGNFKTKEGQATLTGFRLDRFEVTVGRFRQFYRFLQERADAGWAPPVGSGKHTHLNGGQGLVDRAVDGGAAFESGWQSGWDDEVTSAAIRTSFKTCLGATWTDADSSADDRPINCVTWAQAYAFCIWDGGFLPAEAEWNYASAGGSEQRLYPWSPSLSAQQAMWSPDAGYDQNVDCSQANFLYGQQCNPGGAQGVGLTSHVDGGDSRWLQADMAGNVFEWTLDYYPSDYFTHWQCRDCAVLSVADGGPQIRVQRGGAYLSQNYTLVAAYRGSSPVDIPTGEGGFRCAREP